MLRSRLVLLAVAFGLALAAALGGQLVSRAQEPPLEVTTALPAWVAPGGRVLVKGRAGPSQRVRLFIGRKRVASATSGPKGGFVLRGRAPRSGRYRVAVEAAGDPVLRLELGSLRIRPLTLAAVGDVNLGNRVAAAMAAYGVRYPWRSVAPVLRTADLAIANLECAVSTRGSPVPGKLYTFRGRPAALRAAARFAGIDVVSVANNHSLDFGRTAFSDTLRYARAFAVAPVGGGSSLRAARRGAIRGAGGIRVAFLGFSDVRPLGFDAGVSRSGTAPAFPSTIAESVRAARTRADVVIVYFHWGIERATRPSARQRSLAGVAFHAGAHVVLGAHPHVLQPIERTRPRKLVAWSLGNFVFGAHSPGTRNTGILRLRLGSSGVLGYRFRRARIGGRYAVQPRLLRPVVPPS